MKKVCETDRESSRAAVARTEIHPWQVAESFFRAGLFLLWPDPGTVKPTSWQTDPRFEGHDIGSVGLSLAPPAFCCGRGRPKTSDYTPDSMKLISNIGRQVYSVRISFLIFSFLSTCSKGNVLCAMMAWRDQVMTCSHLICFQGKLFWFKRPLP